MYFWKIAKHFINVAIITLIVICLVEKFNGDYITINPYGAYKPEIVYSVLVDYDYEYVGTYQPVENYYSPVEVVYDGRTVKGYVHKILIDIGNDNTYWYVDAHYDLEELEKNYNSYQTKSTESNSYDVYIHRDASIQDLTNDNIGKNNLVEHSFYDDINWNDLITRKGQSLENRLNEMNLNYKNIDSSLTEIDRLEKSEINNKFVYSLITIIILVFIRLFISMKIKSHVTLFSLISKSIINVIIIVIMFNFGIKAKEYRNELNEITLFNALWEYSAYEQLGNISIEGYKLVDKYEITRDDYDYMEYYVEGDIGEANIIEVRRHIYTINSGNKNNDTYYLIEPEFKFIDNNTDYSSKLFQISDRDFTEDYKFLNVYIRDINSVSKKKLNFLYKGY